MKNIRVLHIDTEFTWRGGQQQAVYLYESMLDQGYDTLFVCQPGSPLEKYFKKKNIPYHSLRMHGELDIFAGYKIASLCKNQKFNILHLHAAHAMSIGLFATLFHKDLKLIGVKRVDYHIRKNPLSRYKYSSYRITSLVAISDEIKRVLIDDGIQENRIHVIKSGVDIKKYKSIKQSSYLQEKYGIPENAFVVGTIAALAGHKDYPTFLKAAESIVSRTDNVYFVALGDGPNEKEIMEFADKLDLKDRFIFTGFQKDVGNHLKNFDIFVLSSKKEGLGTSVMDAMAAGIPPVCCRSGGIPELIDDGINGILVDKKNSEALANAVFNLCKNNEKRDELAKHAVLKSKYFDINITVSKNIELYEKLSS